jgi:RNA polymerase sigma-54 factor
VASANWLLKALDQRARTIVRVASEVVRVQQGFFEAGVSQLRPLTLRQVADTVELHESTISRVTANKYLLCERGLFELKYFFTSGVGTGDGEAASALAVKDRIARLIAAEGDDVLSDDSLVDLLKAEGFDIARRTVAKYREALGLGSSVQRRRQRAIRAG